MATVTADTAAIIEQEGSINAGDDPECLPAHGGKVILAAHREWSNPLPLALAALLFFFPTAIAALVFATKALASRRRGDVDSAITLGLLSRRLSMTSIFLSSLVCVVVMVTLTRTLWLAR